MRRPPFAEYFAEALQVFSKFVQIFASFCSIYFISLYIYGRLKSHTLRLTVIWIKTDLDNVW